MAKIFISYRRADTGDMCDRLDSQLSWHLGENAVFRDTHTILAGSDFATVISQGIEDSRVVLVLVGPQWATIADSHGVRLSQPDDYVRREIAQAIRLGKVIVPILIDGATLPPASELPPDIAPVTTYVPLVLRPNPWFTSDLAEIERRIRRFVRRRPASWPITTLSLYSLVVFYGFLSLDFIDIPLVIGPILAVSAILWVRARTERQWGWNVVAVLMPIPFLLFVFSGFTIGLVTPIWFTVLSILSNVGVPLASLTGIVAGLFGPRGRQTTDALEVRLPAVNIVTLIAGITLGLTLFVTDTVINGAPKDSSAGRHVAAITLTTRIVICLLVILTGGIAGMIRAAVLSRWGWFAGLLFGMVVIVAAYVLAFAHTLGILTGILLDYGQLLYCFSLIAWSTSQASRTVQQAMSTAEVRT